MFQVPERMEDKVSHVCLSRSKCVNVWDRADRSLKVSQCGSLGDRQQKGHSEMLSLVLLWACLAFILLDLNLVQAPTMEQKIEQRTVLKFLCNSGSTPIQCWRRMKEVCGEGTMSQTRVWVWHKRFREGQTTFKDQPHTGRPRSACTPTKIQKVRDLLNTDKRSTVRQLAANAEMTKSSVHTILKKDMNLSKLAPKMIHAHRVF